MISRRTSFGAVAGILSLSAFGRFAAAATATDSSVATVSSLCDALLHAMKDGQKLGFAGRRDLLAPTIRSSFDLPLMTRLMVGLQWQNLTAEQQSRLIAAFSNFSIATYANRFDDYSGERFQVEPKPSPTSNGGEIVHTQFIKSDGEPVQIDYLLRHDNGPWQIVDVYLSGTVSELATRRSEFSSVLRRGGPDALVDLLQRRTAELSS